MLYNFCTITTISHLYKAFALYDSLKLLNNNFQLHVLLVDTNNFESDKFPKNFVVHYTKNIKSTTCQSILKKYYKNKDKTRWSLKPVFLKYAISELDIEKIIYVDNDIAFFNDYSFLFDYLSEYNVLLTPHNYSRNPRKNQNWLEANFRVGLYNAGFIGVNKSSSNILDWWADCCLYRCEKNILRGLFDDQKYLDLFPIIEPNTLILSHKGCNVAEWNIEICARQLKNNKVLINGEWDIIFIHFNKTTVQSFIKNHDILLKPYFEKYIDILKVRKPEINVNDEGSNITFTEKIKLFVWNFLNILNNN